MANSSVDVYLEAGKKRIFAGALEWPGWCRSGKSEAEALQALADYRERYARALKGSGLEFKAPVGVAALRVVERLEGNLTTDFGSPDAVPAWDDKTVDAAEVERFRSLLKSCWREFDRIVAMADGGELRTGPRGGGRSLEEIIRHVLEAEAAYLVRVGWKVEPEIRGDAAKLRKAILEAVEVSARGELPTQGPRGGKRWGARFFVRRAAWHVLDHAWEIEDRIQ